MEKDDATAKAQSGEPSCSGDWTDQSSSDRKGCEAGSGDVAKIIQLREQLHAAESEKKRLSARQEKEQLRKRLEKTNRELTILRPKEGGQHPSPVVPTHDPLRPFQHGSSTAGRINPSRTGFDSEPSSQSAQTVTGTTVHGGTPRQNNHSNTAPKQPDSRRVQEQRNISATSSGGISGQNINSSTGSKSVTEYRTVHEHANVFTTPVILSKDPSGVKSPPDTDYKPASSNSKVLSTGDQLKKADTFRQGHRAPRPDSPEPGSGLPPRLNRPASTASESTTATGMLSAADLDNHGGTRPTRMEQITGPKHSKDNVKGQEKVEGQEKVKGQELANVDLPASPSRTCRHNVENQDGDPRQHTISQYSDPVSASMKLTDLDNHGGTRPKQMEQITGPKHSKDNVKGQEKVEGQEKVKGQELANVDLPASPSSTCRHNVENQDGDPRQHTISQYSDPVSASITLNVGPTRGPGIRVRVEVGSLSDSKADVLVNTASASLNLTKGAISNALLNKAGSQLQDECNKTYPRGIKPGQVAVTAGYGLPCKHVFHGALDTYGRNTAECIARLREFIITCLRKASELDLKTIAFPAIGTGLLGYPANIVAAEMFGCVDIFQQQATRGSIQDVIFVVFGGDTTTVQIFKSLEKKMAAHKATRTEATTDAQSQTSDKVVLKIIGIPEDTSKAKHVIADKISVLKKTLLTYSVELPESLVSSLKQRKCLNGQPLTKELKEELDQYDVQMVDLNTHTKLQSTAIASIQEASKHVSRFCADRKMPMDFKIPNYYQVDLSIEDVSELKYKLLCFFHQKTLQKCESDGVTLYYINNDKVIVVSGKPETVGVVQLTIQNILKDIITRLFTEEVALDNVPVKVDVGTVQRRCTNVYIDDFTKKNIVIYGEQNNDVTKAKKQLLESFDLASIGDIPLIKLTAKDRPLEGKGKLNQSHRDRQAGSKVSTGNTSKDRQTTSQQEGQYTKSQQNAGTRQEASQRNAKPFSWSTDTRNAKVFATREGIIIRVYEADILNLPVDCIVNIANSRLNHFSGIACIIATAAGQDLIREVDEHVKANGILNVGDAVPTTAGKLRYRCVVHTVLSEWTSYSPHTTESVTRCEKDLHRAIRNSIVEADNNTMVDSIAVTGIGAISFGIPIEIYAGVYAEAIISYSRQKASPSLKEIHVIDKDSQIVRAIQDTFDTMITKGMSNPRSLHCYTSTGLSNARQTSNVQEIGRSFEVEKKQPFFPVYYEELVKRRGQKQLVCKYGTRHELIIYSGDIFHLQNIDAIVCREDITGSANGMVAKLLIKDNPQYEREKADAFKRKAPEIGHVVTTKGGKFSFKWVLHALVPQIADYTYDQRTWGRDLQKMIDTLLEEMAIIKSRSVVMSLLGAGHMSTNPQDCAEIFQYSYSAFCTKYPQLSCQMHLVNKDPPTTDTVKHVFKRHIDELRRSQGTGGQSGSHSQGRYVSMSGAKQPGRSHSGSQSQYSSDVSMSGATAMLSKQPGNSQSGSQSQYSSDVSMSGATAMLSKQPGNSQSGSQSEYSSDVPMFGATAMLPKQPGNSQSGTRPHNSHNNTGTRPGSPVRVHDTRRHGPTSQTYTRNSQDGKGNLDGASFEDTKKDNCVICMDQMTNPKKLSCGHFFCTDCIDLQFTYKQACPACGAVCGVITGDQPDGDMQVHYVSTSVAGYEQCGCIQITYIFRSGQQGPSHPQPGHTYKGITRTAYLPDNEEGQLVLAMLKVAFKRKVVFTIGSSRTTGHEGVITWNDIHHKTDHRQNTQFGYPDPTYLARVKDELAAKGLTEADVK